MMNRFVKNGRIRKFWLTEITGPLPEVIPNILVAGKNLSKFQESLHFHKPRFSSVDAL